MKIWSSGASEKFDLSDGWGEVWGLCGQGFGQSGRNV